MDMVNQTSGLGAGDTVIRVYEIISHAIFRSFSFDNLVQGFSGVMFFPENGNIGFAIMCPLVVIALVAFILWYKKIFDVPKKRPGPLSDLPHSGFCSNLQLPAKTRSNEHQSRDPAGHAVSFTGIHPVWYPECTHPFPNAGPEKSPSDGMRISCLPGCSSRPFYSS